MKHTNTFTYKKNKAVTTTRW